MNTLSWLIYAADVLPNLSVTLLLCGLAVVAAWGASALIVAVHNSNNGYSWNKGRADKNLPSKHWFWAPAVLVLIASLLPETNTIYLIAASQMGEQVVTTPEAQEVFDKLQTIVSHQLDELVAEATE